MKSPGKYVPRVTQLDAVELDNEIVNILKNKVVSVTKYLPAGFLGQWEPEIDALLRYTIWRFSVAKTYGTFGQQLLSLKYGGDFSKNKANLFALLTIGTRYLKHRSHEVATATGNSSSAEKVKSFFNCMETCIQLASIVNLLVFLTEGKYPLLVDRVLGLQLVSAAPSGQTRTVGYSYMTRELLWHGFIELLVFMIPLINYHSLKRRFTNLLPWKKKDVQRANLIYTATSKCAECSESPVLPHHMGCSHVFCYYCLKANLLADEDFQCPMCGYSVGNAAAVQQVQLE